MLNPYLTFLALGFNFFLHVEAQVGTEGLIVYPDYKNHSCKRTCNGVVRDCYYNITLEWMYSMEPTCGNCLTGTPADCSNPTCIVADGLPRILMAFNRRLPGPTIEVCQGDTIIVDLHNDLVDVDTAIHWHGQDNLNTNYMDGVAFITQCPIYSGTTFRYRFRAMQSGTHWAHSHGFQRATGAFFPLIVKVPTIINPHYFLYDYDLSEHVITLIEWSSVIPLIYNSRINRMRIVDQFLTNILVNGVGANDTNVVPPQRFNVIRGFKYRFRLIGAASTICPIKMKIDGHRMKIISTDGHDIEPIDVDTLIISPGERIDIVINVNQTIMDYTIRFDGLMDCENITGKALLHYSSATTLFRPTTTQNGKVFNCINTPSNTPDCVSYFEVRSVDLLENPLINILSTYKYYFQMDIYNYALPKYQGVGNNKITTSTINNINFKFPSTPMIQNLPMNSTCNYESTTECRQASRVCICTHMLEIRLYDIVELIFVNEGSLYNVSHPIHLHGQSFRVIGQHRLGSQTTTAQVRQMDAEGLLLRNYYRPAKKDTIAVPDGGYVIIKFQALNPGYWFLNCQIEHHALEGMALVLKVGNPPAAPANFAQCGNYLG